MESVSLSRTIEAPQQVVADHVLDVERFMKAAGFDEVRVDGDLVEISNSVGLLSIELTLEVVDTDALLAYEQVEGIFETMETRYTLSGSGAGVTVTAVTEFALDVDLVGPILDGTIITRQRTKELSSQFDYLERIAGNRAAG
jgi:hypothetical protein